MGRKFYLYNSNGELKISTYMLPEHETKDVQKYNGKSARIKAIKEIAGIDIDEGMTVREIKNIISARIYNTPLWGRYRAKFDELLHETIPIEVRNEYINTVVVPVMAIVGGNFKAS